MKLSSNSSLNNVLNKFEWNFYKNYIHLYKMDTLSKPKWCPL